MQRFHHRQFADLDALVALKKSQRISVCIPTLNEADTIGPIVTTIRDSLVSGGLVDEILVIDSDSSDGTREIAAAAGAKVYRSSEILPDEASYPGKGENLWKALQVASGDIICYIDGDISSFHSGFVTGLVGPLLRIRKSTTSRHSTSARWPTATNRTPPAAAVFPRFSSAR